MTAIDPERWKTLEPLLDQALELGPEERGPWLEELSARSPALAADLSLLLAGEGEADRRGFLSGALDVGLAGVELGAYRLERPLGQGGMGTVWLAARSDGRFEGQAAVKILNLALFTPTGQERFRREGSLLARLAHPGIARLLDAGLSGAGQPYLVLEYVEGLPIDAYARERRLSPTERIDLFLQVLSAVGHAHSHLIVHRDLKPSNILVTPDGAVKLLDFGIAKLLDDEAAGPRSALTLEGGRVLTPQYAAPEQVRDEHVTTATDVYALGVLLYLLLSGRHPTGEGCRTPAESVRSLLETEPAGLGLGDLDNIVDKALRKEPTERYLTVAAFADDLGHYLRREPVAARAHSLPYRVGKFVRRNRTAVAAGAIIAAGLLGATVFSTRQMRYAQLQRDAAVRESRRADAQVEFQNMLLSNVGDRAITMREVLDAARGVLERQSAGDPRIQTTLLLQLAGSYRELGDTRVRDTILVRAESLALATGDTAHLAEARCDLADLRRKQGRYEEAWQTLGPAESLAQASRDPGTEVECLSIHANLAGETRRGAEALSAARRAVAIKDSLGLNQDWAYLDLLGILAYALDAVGQGRDAVVIQRRMIATIDSSGRGGTLDRAIMGHNMGLTLFRLGEVAEAERLFEKTLERFALGDRSGHVPPSAAIHYAEAALAEGHVDSALKYFNILVVQGIADSSTFWEGLGWFGVGRTQARLGHLADARRAKARLERVLKIHPGITENDGPIPDGQALGGWIALAEGDTARARAQFVGALRANGYYEGKERTRLRQAALAVAECDLTLGQTSEALTLAREVLATAMVDSLAANRSAVVGEARLMEARALLAAGDTEAAQAAVRLALVPLQVGGGREHPATREAEALAVAIQH